LSTILIAIAFTLVVICLIAGGVIITYSSKLAMLLHHLKHSQPDKWQYLSGKDDIFSSNSRIDEYVANDEDLQDETTRDYKMSMRELKEWQDLLIKVFVIGLLIEAILGACSHYLLNLK
jgi:hypothetical protein